MDEEQQDAAVRRIYDGMARTYDASFSQSGQGDRLRSWVQEQLRMRFRPGDRVLDIGCGTGTDAIFLAKHGVRLTSLDISPRMIETAGAKIRAAGVEDRVQVSVLDFRNLPPAPDRLFDGAFSNFDTLNYADDLSGFADRIGAQLRPGAPLLCLLLNPLCLWEVVYFLVSLQPARAFRRLTQRGRDLMVGQEPLALTLYFPRA
ncbi:MAG TPA: class I SAM-dependent methyltransferase, partial [Bacteroidota bacterium]